MNLSNFTELNKFCLSVDYIRNLCHKYLAQKQVISSRTMVIKDYQKPKVVLKAPN